MISALPFGVRKSFAFPSRFKNIEAAPPPGSAAEPLDLLMTRPEKHSFSAHRGAKSKTDEIILTIRLLRSGTHGLLHPHLEYPSLRGFLDLEHMPVEWNCIALGEKLTCFG